MSKFTVTRQMPWGEDRLIVEVNQGNLDYANPGMLAIKYPGEGETYIGMLPALMSGIEIAKKWQADQPEEAIMLGIGNTHGFTMPFDGVRIKDTKAIEQLIATAKKFDESLPKCQQCGEILGDEKYRHEFSDEYCFCSANCADTDYEHCMRDYAEPVDED